MARLLDENSFTLRPVGQVAMAETRGSSAMAPASHSVSLEARLSDGSYLFFTESTPVRPGSPIRLVANGLRPLSTVRFVLTPEGSAMPVLNVSDLHVGITGLATLDAVAPSLAGRYIFTASGVSGLFGTLHPSFTVLVVSASAVPLPEPPPPGGLRGLLEEIQYLLIIGAVIAGLVIVVPRVLPPRK